MTIFRRKILTAALMIGVTLAAGGILSSASGKNTPERTQAAPNEAKFGVKKELLSAPDVADAAWSMTGEPEGKVKAEIVPCGLPGHPKARRITILKPDVNAYWNIQLKQETPAAVPASSVLRLHFWARSKTRNGVYAVFEHNGEPYEKFLSTLVFLTPEWKEYKLVFKLPRDIPEKFAGVRFQCGLKAGEFEITGIALEDWGVNPNPMPDETKPDPWGGQTHNDDWRKAAEARIEAIRKGALVVRVVDSGGKPIPGATVNVEQKRHKFRFGTAISSSALFDTSPDGAKYREILLRDFNCVVLENALKWPGENGPNFDTADKMLTWCAAHNLPVRGHNLFWPSYQYMPEAAKNLRGDALKKAVHDHVTDYAARARGRVYVWDVINEAVVNHEATDEMGGDKVRAEIYEWAHQADPNALLAYNDYDVLNNHAGANDTRRAEVFAVIKQMLKDGAPITSLGEQAHMSLPLTPANKLISLLDGWGQFHLPVEITEYDFATHDDKLQAEYTEEFLTAVFSHPAVTSFLMWGFWEGAHWLGREGGAMYNRDWTPRPAAKVYEDLVLRRWRTKAEDKTNGKGEIKLRAFLGTHEITVTAGGRTATAAVQLERGGDAATTVTVRLP